MPIGPSERSLHLTLFWEEEVMAVGTGFIGELDGRHYLITVKHNLTGRNPTSGEFLGSACTGPNKVTVRARAVDPRTGWVNVSLPLYNEDCSPRWFEDFEHPEFDIAALEIELDPAAQFVPYPLNEPQPDLHPTLAVTDELFVVGFPRGLAYNVSMPIWSRGTIASEPGAGYNGQPVFLIDVRTTKGHSGSPVILKPKFGQPVQMLSGETAIPQEDGMWVAGVYSGRVKTSGRKLNLGIVWRLGAVIRVIQGRTTRDEWGTTRWLPLPDEGF